MEIKYLSASNIASLNVLVNEHLADGWKLYGDLTAPTQYQYIQAMTKGDYRFKKK